MLKESDIQYLLFFYNNCNIPISQHYRLEKQFEKEFRTKISSMFKVDMGTDKVDDSHMFESESILSPCSSTCSSGYYKTPSSASLSSFSKQSKSDKFDDTERDMPIISVDPEKLKRYYENFDNEDTEGLTLEDIIERLKILDNLSKE